MAGSISPQNKYSNEFKSIESIQDLLTKADAPEAVAQIFDATEEVVQTVKQKASLWTSIVSFFSNLFGKVSDYQRLQLEVEKLESQLQKKVEELSSSPRDSSPEETAELTNKLTEVQAEIKTLGDTIISDLNELIAKFDEVDEHLAGLERQSDREDQTESQIRQNIEEASKLANFFQTIQTSMVTASNMYYENETTDFSPIITLHTRYSTTEKRLKAIQDKQIAQWIAQQQPVQKASAVESTEQTVIVGGIRNGGNSCYVASAIQTINAVPSYRKAFDPEQNPLKQHTEETQESFEQRKLIQERGFNVLQKIQSGVTISQEEINAFRKACYDHKQAGYKTDQRVIKSLGGMDDSAERLERFLEVMDYQFGSYQVQIQRTPITTNPVLRYDIDPKGISTWEEFTKQKVEVKIPTIEVSAYAYLNDSVDMQSLIEETWADEQIEGVWISSEDEQGNPCVKEYRNCTLHKEANAKEAPEVIRVTVKQLEEDKATIKKANRIYPFGRGNGPAYELKSIIEHRPGHYVAHIPQKDGSSIEANDSWVHAGKKDITGFAYYYVRVES